MTTLPDHIGDTNEMVGIAFCFLLGIVSFVMSGRNRYK